VIAQFWLIMRRALSHPAFKILIAVLVLYFLYRFNRLSFSQIEDAVNSPSILLLALLSVLPTYLIVSLRFKVILNNLGVAMPFRDCFSLTMIGSYFDLAMPSSNGGDIVKAGYLLGDLNQEQRYQAVMAVGIDRVVGVIGLFSLAFLSCMVGWRELEGFSQRVELASVVFILGIFPLLVFRITGSRRLLAYFKKKLADRPSKIGDRAVHVLDAFNRLRENPGILPVVIVLSMLNHLLWCTALFLIVFSVGDLVSVFSGLVTFPLAIFGGVFGVAGGFGLGTAAFDLIFTTLLSLNSGATVGIIFQLVGAVSRVLGLPFYLYAKPNASTSPMKTQA